MNHKINVILFGIGTIGSALINKIVRERKELILDAKIDIRVPVITNATVAFFEKEGANFSWEANFIQFGVPFKLDDVMLYIIENKLENVVIVDATASTQLAGAYLDFIRNGFNLVSINETLQFLPDSFEKGIRFLAETHEVEYTFVNTMRSRTLAIQELYEAIIEMGKKQREYV